MNLDVVVVGKPFGYMAESIPVGAKVFIEKYDGYNKALNNGARKGKSEYIAFCNNDITFYSNSVRYLLDALKKYDSVSGWCPKTHKDWWGSETPVGWIEGYQIGKIVTGWCLFMKRSTWEQIGGFDERLDFWGCDNAYAEQLKQHNLKHALIPEAIIEHKKSQTLRKLPPKEYRRLTFEQLRLFRKLYPNARNK